MTANEKVKSMFAKSNCTIKEFTFLREDGNKNKMTAMAV